MKILFVINTLGYGGAEVFTARLANALRSKKHEVTVYVHNYGFDGLVIKNNFNDDIEIKFFKLNAIATYFMWKLNALTTLFGFSFKEWLNKIWFKYFIAKENFTIISNQGIVTDEWLAGMQLPAKIVSTIHEDYYYLFQKQGESLIKRINNFANKINHFIYLSERSKEYLVRNFYVTESKFTKIYNGFDYTYSPSRNNSTIFTFGMIARGTDDKGWPELFKAFELLYAENRNIKLIAIGGQNYFNGFEEKYKHLPIQFISSTNNPLNYIKQFDAGVLPSIAECLPNFIVECLANGIPVIATDVGEVSNMIKIGECDAGILIKLTKSRADIFEIKNAMVTLLNNLKYQQFKNNTELCYQQFDMDICVEKYLSVFKTCQ